MAINCNENILMDVIESFMTFMNVSDDKSIRKQFREIMQYYKFILMTNDDLFANTKLRNNVKYTRKIQRIIIDTQNGRL